MTYQLSRLALPPSATRHQVRRLRDTEVENNAEKQSTSSKNGCDVKTRNGLTKTLGWGALLAVGAVAEIDREDLLEFSEDAVETQPAPTAFGWVAAG